MKRFFCTILSALLLLSSTQVVLADGKFSDIEDNPYRENIEVLQALGVVKGYEGDEFKPDQAVNRAELLKIVFAVLDEAVVDFPGDCFDDVQDQWFAPYICKAKDAAVVEGYEDGTYKPGQEVNMVEAMKIAMIAFEMPLDELEEGANWYQPYMDFAHINNLFSKYSYFPSQSATRGEVSFLVHSVLKIKNGEESTSTNRYVGTEGCGKNPPANPSTQFMVAGVERSAITVIPSSYNYDAPIPIIFAFHGRTNPNTMVRGYYDIEEASAGKAIIVYPAGIKKDYSYTWSDSGDKADELRDYEFFDVMLEEFESSYCIDVDRVYAVGHSLGAWFTNSLACARGDLIRGVATLGGSRSNSECAGPVAVMQWHNPNDNLALFSTGVMARDWFVEQNQCSAETEAVAPFFGNCVEYQGCLNYAPTIWCPHTQDYNTWNGAYYPHTWPDGTGEEMWGFLSGLE